MPTRKTTAPPAEDMTEEAKEIFGNDLISIDGVYVSRPDGAPLGLYGRLARITASLPEVKPEGENKHFGYRFISDKQVNGLIRPRLARQLISIIPESVEEYGFVEMKTAKGGTSYMTKIHVTWRVVDGITGESFTGQSLGYGDDSGDKGANKAFTAAFKNYLIKLFQLGGENDIEEDEDTDKRAAARESGTDRVQTVKIEPAAGGGTVARGGRQEESTEGQMMLASKYARDLSLTPESMMAIIIRTNPGTPGYTDPTWADVKTALGSLSGDGLAKLLQKLDELSKATDAE